MLDSPSPGCGFLLQTCTGAALANEVPDLVQGDKVRDLTPDGCDPDVQRSHPTTSSLERATTPTAGLALDAVFRAQLVDVPVEGL
jgi:hypothetical protein